MVRIVKDYLIKFFDYTEEPYNVEEPKELKMGIKHTKLLNIQDALKSLSEQTGYVLPKDSEGNLSVNSGFLRYLAEWVINAKEINQELLIDKGTTFETRSKQIADRIIEILKEEKQNGN